MQQRERHSGRRDQSQAESWRDSLRRRRARWAGAAGGRRGRAETGTPATSPDLAMLMTPRRPAEVSSTEITRSSYGWEQQWSD